MVIFLHSSKNDEEIIMNKIKLLMLTSIVFVSAQGIHQIKLDSIVLHHADGRFPIGINGDVIALIKQYQGKMAMLLYGKKTATGYEGIFEFEGKKYTIQELIMLENERGTQALYEVRQEVIKKYEEISQPFRMLIKVYGIKSLMGDLIEESVIKRNRADSLLYVWAKTEEKNELEILHKNIHAVKDIELFMIDLNNFLGDIVYNCPRGYAQYKEHVEKFNKAAQYAQELQLNKKQYDLFLKYINKNITPIEKSAISLEKVKELYNEFKPTLSAA